MLEASNPQKYPYSRSRLSLRSRIYGVLLLKNAGKEDIQDIEGYT